MKHSSSFFSRVLVIAVVLVASTDASGFSLSMSTGRSGGSSQSGVLVISVPSGSPAGKAGLVRGDIILTFDGSAVNSAREVREAVLSHAQRDTISLGVLHGGRQKTLSVVLGHVNRSPYLGARFLTDERYRISMAGPGHVDWSRELSGGAYVARVSLKGPAYKAGIRHGDVILSVDGVRIDKGRSLASMIESRKIGETVTLAVRSWREPMYQAPKAIKVTLQSTPNTRMPSLGVEYREASPVAFSAPWNKFPRVANLLKDLGILHGQAPTA